MIPCVLLPPRFTITKTMDIDNTQAHAAVLPAEASPLLLGPGSAGRDRLAREAKYLINEAFHEPTPGISYYVSQRIADLFPERSLIECQNFAFDPVRYASAGECRMSFKECIHPHWILNWEESGEQLGKVDNRLSQGWFSIEWQGEQLEVLMMHWQGQRGYTRHCFVLADTRDVGVRFLRVVCAWNSQPREELLVFDGDTWKKDEDLFRSIQGAQLDNLILPGTMKDDLVADVTGFFAARETYHRYGVPWKRGILLVGTPGNGKTHAVKALVNALPQRCLYVKSFRGHGDPDEYSIADVFTKARRCAPCILVLEDLDSLVTKHNRSFFLNEMDGFAGNDGILTLATTNHPGKLDQAISRRPSRFDRTYHFDLPKAEVRRAYLEHWNGSLEPEMRIGADAVHEVGELTVDFSFAYLKELCLSGLMSWIQTARPGGMEQALREQVDVLRSQMATGRDTSARLS